MIHFANPQYLYALIIIPVIIGLFVLSLFAQKNKLKIFGAKINPGVLMPFASKYLPTIKLSIALAALFFLIVAQARPFVYSNNNVNMSADTESVKGIELMICCDVSNSMLASSTNDIYGITRLQKAKFILDKSLNWMRNDKVGIIVFAGDAYLQLPLTPDVLSAKMYVNDLSTNMVPTQGTAIGAAIATAVNAFDPESDFSKAIVVITDGENFEDDAVEAAKSAAQAGIQVDVIGMGTSGDGMPIPDKNSPSGFLVYDGQEVKTALDETAAAEIAKAGNGIYISGDDNSAVDDLETQLRKLKTTEYKRSIVPSGASDLFPIMAIIALILLIVDVMLPNRKLKLLSRIKFFSKD